MIQKLSIKGFRSLKEVSWKPGKLNVIIGPNGSGKSNLLRALALLQKAAKGELPQAVLEQGGIAPLLWDATAKDITWTLEKTIGVRPGLPGGKLTYELTLRQLGDSSAYRIEHELLGSYYSVELGHETEPFKFLERSPRRAVTFDLQEHALAAHEGSVPDDQTLLALVAGPFGNPIIIDFRERLVSWSIHHDLPIHQQAPIRQAAVARVEKRIAADGQNLIPVLHSLYASSREFKKSLDSAMRAAFGDDYVEIDFPPAADQRVQLRLRWRSLNTDQSAADLSDGTIRFLLLVAIFASPSPGDLVAVDEPEVGLHPAMFPVIAELAAEASERTQVVITTHSPQLLDAFTEVAPTTTVARWIDGRTELSILDRDELRRWLKEYSLGSLFRSGELEALG
jgi:predicted ATPase